MSVFKCKMCGGELELPKGANIAECPYCGTKQTLPRLNSEKQVDLYERANHFRRNNEFDKAMGIYEQILNEDNTDAEAYWSLVLCRYGIEYVEDPSSRKRIPTVNRVQFTSIFDDDNYKLALQYADDERKPLYEEEAKVINEIQKGILAISQEEEPFDVFICYKESDNSGRRTPDSVLATELYHELTEAGYKVFFSRITLEDKLGTAYEPYIFAALNSAKVMVVLGTKPEYFNAVWVKNEWSRYLALIKNGAKKMLIPAYKDMDPYDLPEEFSHLQAQDMSKLGFVQDLIRGIKKILPQPAAPQQIVDIQSNSKKKTNSKKIIVIIAAVLVAAIVALICLLTLNKGGSNAPENTSDTITSSEQTSNTDDNNSTNDSLNESITNIDSNDTTSSNTSSIDPASLDYEYETLSSGVKLIKYKGDSADVSIPSTINGVAVTSIGKDTFKDSPTLSSVTIPNTVSIIGEYAFYGCVSLKSVTIPKSVTTIEVGAFAKCSKLESIIIPNSVTKLGSAVFYECSSLTSVTLSSKITEFEINTFYCCTSLESITLPSGVKKLGDAVFQGCSSLKSINIPNGVTSLGKYVFAACKSLESITVPNTVTSIGDYAFSSCQFTSINIPMGITSIGNNVFNNCSKLVSINIPTGVTSIGNYVFKDCSNLASINIPNTVTSIGDGAFNKCSSLTAIVIPDSVKSIGSGAFSYCTSLESVNIPSQVTVLASGLFERCESIKSFIIPSNITRIEDDVFNYCYLLESITIPDSVVSLDYFTYECESLETVYFQSEEQKEKFKREFDTDVTLLVQ